MSQNYRIVRAEGQRGPWKVTIAAYHYTLEEPDGREVISFQWHPEGVTAKRDRAAWVTGLLKTLEEPARLPVTTAR